MLSMWWPISSSTILVGMKVAGCRLLTVIRRVDHAARRDLRPLGVASGPARFPGVSNDPAAGPGCVHTITGHDDVPGYPVARHVRRPYREVVHAAAGPDQRVDEQHVDRLGSHHDLPRPG